jgi:hypothetical protein
MGIIKSYIDFKMTVSEASNADELRDKLSTLGYAEKSKEISSGGDITDDIQRIAEVVLAEFKKIAPDVKVTVTGGNDAFHHNLSYVSRHTKGQAIDLTINPNTAETRQQLISVLDRVSDGTPGFSYIDEYSNPTKAATGGHFHLSYGSNPENQRTANAKTDDPIEITGLTGAVATGSADSTSGVIIDSDLIARLISKLKEKNFSEKDLAKFAKTDQRVELSSKEDEDFYKAILKGLGANETPEKIKFLKAWRQGEGGKATNNPFNTTKDVPGDEDTKYNSVGVRNYPDRQTGLNATLDTLKLPYYKELVAMLKDDNVTAVELANSKNLDTWGTGEMVRKVLAGGRVNPPAIA